MLKNNGPKSYANWIASTQKKEIQRTYEYPLFTDTQVTGEMFEECGPYKLLNTFPMYRPKIITPNFILRIDDHIEPTPDMDIKTDTSSFHGGGAADEIAALISLELGIRLKAGSYTRIFEPNKDPKGDPTMHFMNLDPILIKGLDNRPIIPYPNVPVCINDLLLLKQYNKIPPDAAIALVKSARLYQDALWISESQPAFSWLFFVSAIEIAANHWRKKEKATPLERLEAGKPKLAEKLEKLLGDYNLDLSSKVAELISDFIGSTKKFVDFLICFLPDPPIDRPSGYMQISWDEDNMKKYLRSIYNLRSEALHNGTPFPAPICMAPYGPSREIYREKATNTNIKTLGSTWEAKDVPMYLHMFEYIVRKALLKWWRSMIG